MQIIINNLAITYDILGKGPSILLLHGWGDDHNTYKKLAPILSDRYQLISLDLPGFGRSQSPDKAWDLDDYADIVEAFLNKLNINTFAIIGHSNGGALAIRGLSTGKLKANKLVLIASAGVRNTHKVRKHIVKIIAKVGKVFTVWMSRSTREKLQKKLYGTVGSDLLLKPELKETFKLTVRQDIQNDAKELNIPVLLINADRDPAIPLEDGKRLNELINGSVLEVIDANDHFIHQSYAARVGKLILSFL